MQQLMIQGLYIQSCRQLHDSGPTAVNILLYYIKYTDFCKSSLCVPLDLITI